MNDISSIGADLGWLDIFLGVLLILTCMLVSGQVLAILMLLGNTMSMCPFIVKFAGPGMILVM